MNIPARLSIRQKVELVCEHFIVDTKIKYHIDFNNMYAQVLFFELQKDTYKTMSVRISVLELDKSNFTDHTNYLVNALKRRWERAFTC